MTDDTTQAPPAQPTRPPAPATAAPSPSMGRLVGVDLARALAVFGMFTVHIGTPEAPGQLDGWLLRLAEGRSSVLFATLAGFSLMLIAGRMEPKTGIAGRQAKARIAIRAAILLVLGSALVFTAGDIVILNFYGVFFLLALPLLRLRAKTLAILAAVLAVAGPILSLVLRTLLTEPITNSINAIDPLERLNGQGVLDLFLTGLYPAATWMPIIIAGMALGRLDISAAAIQRRLAGLGAALITLAYGTPWLLSRLIPSFREATATPADTVKDFAGSSAGKPMPGKELLGGTDWGWSMLTANPHTGTTFDILGSLGVAITIIVALTALLARLPQIARLAKPIIAVGTMSLTVYVAHLLALPFVPSGKILTLLGFIITAILFATIWSRYFRRGPLEYLLNHATNLAKFIK